MNSGEPLNNTFVLFQICNSTVFVYKKATTSFEFCSHSKTFFLELTHHEKLCNRSYIQASNAYYNDSKNIASSRGLLEKTHFHIFNFYQAIVTFNSFQTFSLFEMNLRGWKFYFNMEHCCLLAMLK